jgi:hypothetical protein
VLAWIYFGLTNPTESDSSSQKEEENSSNNNDVGVRYKSIEYILSSVRFSFPMLQANPNGNLTRMVSMLSMEFIGTFMIAWCLALSSNAQPGERAIAVGAAVVSMVYAGGAVSGAHYSPGVTLAVYLRGLLEEHRVMRAVDAGLYVGTQVSSEIGQGRIGQSRDAMLCYARIG